MDLTPHSSRSSTSSQLLELQSATEYQSSHFSDRSSRPLHDTHYTDFYSTTAATSAMTQSMGMSSMDTMHQAEPLQNQTWRGSVDLQRSTSLSRQSSIPSSHPSEYESLTSYLPSSTAPFPGLYSTSTIQHNNQNFCPLSTGSTSQRSSFSSVPLSDVLTQADSVHSYTPLMKTEDPTDFPIGSDPLILGPSHMSQGILGGPSTFPGGFEGNYYNEATSTPWSKVDYSNLELPSIASLPIPQYDRRSESQDVLEASSSLSRKPSNSVARTRQPRKLTTKEEANFQCHVKGCGKLFGRSYNYKAHMETHDASREYPFPCTQPDCDKKFVRKTDLQRHHQSVHMKQRNFRCDYCSRLFARKDTLRRHMEDGCSKRFDIEVVDYHPSKHEESNNAESRSTLNANDVHPQHRLPPYNAMAPFSELSSMHPNHHSSPMPSFSDSHILHNRHDYMSSGQSSTSGWHS